MGHFHRIILRAAYALAASAAAFEAWFGAIGGPGQFSAAIFGSPRQDVAGPTAAGVLAAACLAAAFAYLVFRSAWWGKLLCAFAATAWLAFGVPISVLGMSVGRFGFLELLPILGPAGIMVAVGVTHQVIEPSFGRSQRLAAKR